MVGHNQNTYSGKNNWGQPQPVIHDNTAAYLDMAYQRRQLFNEIIDDIAAKAGSGVRITPASVKEPESAERKLWDRTSTYVGQPERISDYLRARMYVPAKPGATSQIIDAIDQLLDHPLTVGHKDCHWHPKAQTAWRDTKVSMNIDGLRAEFQLIARNPLVQAGNQITEVLRLNERAIRAVEERFEIPLSTKGVLDSKSVRSYNKIIERAEDTIGDIRQLRSSVHDFIFAGAGLNGLLDPDILADHTPVTASSLVKMFRGASRKYFGGTIGNKLIEPVQQMVLMPPTSHVN